jgi:hypothetical protein
VTKTRLWAGLVAAISTFAAVALAGMLSVNPSLVRAQSSDNQGNEYVKIQQGFAIAPVPLNLVGKDPALVGLGSYIVNAQVDCNGCHTLSPAVEYTSTGNPFMLSPPFKGKATPNPLYYLAGGQDFVPFPGGPGSIPHLYSRNLTPDKTGAAGGWPHVCAVLTDYQERHGFRSHSPELYRSRHACQLPAVIRSMGIFCR